LGVAEGFLEHQLHGHAVRAALGNGLPHLREVARRHAVDQLIIVDCEFVVCHDISSLAGQSRMRTPPSRRRVPFNYSANTGRIAQGTLTVRPAKMPMRSLCYSTAR